MADKPASPSVVYIIILSRAARACSQLSLGIGTVMENESNLTIGATQLEIPWCPAKLGRMDSAAYALVTVNLLSIWINIFHLIVLSKIPALKGTAYYHILVHFSLADIFNAISVACRMALNKENLFQNFSFTSIAIYDVLMDTMQLGRHFIAAVSSLERYYALCKPFNYDSSHYTTKLHLWLPMSWILVFGLFALRDSALHDGICYSQMLGPTNLLGKGAIITLGFMIILGGVTAVLLLRVGVEMYRMRRRTASTKEMEVKNATVYLIVNIVTFYVCLLPQIANYVVVLFGIQSLLNVYLCNYLPCSVYGIVDSFVYGWMTSAYRRRIRLMLGCGNKIASRNT